MQHMLNLCCIMLHISIELLGPADARPISQHGENGIRQRLPCQAAPGCARVSLLSTRLRDALSTLCYR